MNKKNRDHSYTSFTIEENYSISNIDAATRVSHKSPEEIVRLMHSMGLLPALPRQPVPENSEFINPRENPSNYRELQNNREENLSIRMEPLSENTPEENLRRGLITETEYIEYLDVLSAE